MFRRLQRRLQRLEQGAEPLAGEREACWAPSMQERVQLLLLILQRQFSYQHPEIDAIRRASDYYSTASDAEAEAFFDEAIAQGNDLRPGADLGERLGAGAFALVLGRFAAGNDTSLADE